MNVISDSMRFPFVATHPLNQTERKGSVLWCSLAVLQLQLLHHFWIDPNQKTIDTILHKPTNQSNLINLKESHEDPLPHDSSKPHND